MAATFLLVTRNSSISFALERERERERLLLMPSKDQC
jgi:hypothetical protein